MFPLSGIYDSAKSAINQVYGYFYPESEQQTGLFGNKFVSAVDLPKNDGFLSKLPPVCQERKGMTMGQAFLTGRVMILRDGRVGVIG